MGELKIGSKRIKDGKSRAANIETEEELNFVQYVIIKYGYQDSKGRLI